MAVPVRVYKLVTVGDGAVGKTSLLYCYANNTFIQDHIPTIVDNYTVTITSGSATVQLSIWDTAGQEEYVSVRNLSYKNTHVFVLCFALDNPCSLENVETKWAPELQHSEPGVPIILVGTKADAREDPMVVSKLKVTRLSPVTKQHGEAIAKKIHAVKYIETSAKTGENVKLVFDEAVKAVLRKEEADRRASHSCWVRVAQRCIMM